MTPHSYWLAKARSDIRTLGFLSTETSLALASMFIDPAELERSLLDA